ncbi:MAG: cyclase family protein [Acidipila sp.]|nr:cyclase family protein [Acidipila sp.]
MRRTVWIVMLSVFVTGAQGKPARQKRIVDLTDTIRVGLVKETLGEAMIVKGGIHEVRFEPEMNFRETTGRSTYMSISTQIGTHMDAGAHVEPEGWPIDQVDLDHVMGPGVVVDFRAKTAADPVNPSDLEKYKIRAGDIVIFYFHYETPKPGELYSQSYLTDETAQYLVAKGVRCIGSNTPGIENYKRGVANHWTDPANQKIAWPVHKTLLGNHIPIIEGLVNLDAVIGKRFQFIGLPLKIAGADGSPIRAIAILE